MEISDTLTIHEAAEEWGVSPSTISKWYRVGLVTRWKEDGFYVHPRREIADAYYSTATRFPTLETLLEEADFFMGFGMPAESMILRLAQSYSLDAKKLRYKLQDHYPELRRGVGASGYVDSSRV